MSYPVSTSCGEVGKILHLILDNVLPFKTDGTFVEVGANDGKTGSFTYNLGRIGWNGINFEPVPRLYNLCCKNHINHTNVKNFQIGIGATQSEATIIDAGTLSTIDTDTIECYSNTPQFASSFKNNNNFHKIKIEKLNTMLDNNQITNIDMLVLDVEGYEINVLNGFSVETYNPTIFIIEIADQHPDFINNQIMMDKGKVLRKYFNDNNYSLLVNDIVDNVYIHNSIYKNVDEQFIEKIRKMVRFPQFV